jgi:hypothetical protein
MQLRLRRATLGSQLNHLNSERRGIFFDGDYLAKLNADSADSMKPLFVRFRVRCDGSRFATEAEALLHLKSLTGKGTNELRKEKKRNSQKQLQTRFKMYMESLGCRTELFIPTFEPKPLFIRFLLRLYGDRLPSDLMHYKQIWNRLKRLPRPVLAVSLDWKLGPSVTALLKACEQTGLTQKADISAATLVFDIISTMQIQISFIG